MARGQANDFPPEVLKLFDGYIHGVVARRDSIERATRYATVGFGAAAMLGALTPNCALAAELAKDDPRIVSAVDPEGRSGSHDRSRGGRQ